MLTKALMAKLGFEIVRGVLIGLVTGTIMASIFGRKSDGDKARQQQSGRETGA